MRPIALCLALLMLVPSIAQAADFAAKLWNGRTVLEMSGRIDAGTAQKFAAALPSIPPAEHGYPILLLNSPGGLIQEAFAMSRIMQAHPVHTVIPDGARCASSCASIVFIAGHYRTVEPFGAFGQHSCASNGIRNQQCNDAVSEHAIQHGVSHGSVAAFVTYADPSQMIWMSRMDVDGWGISRYPGSEAVGWEKSEPRFFEMIGHPQTQGQNLWRLDFFGSGWRAFHRAVRDDERELQVNVGCLLRLPASLVIWMEIHGPAQTIGDAVRFADFETDSFALRGQTPIIWQIDEEVSGLMLTIPTERVAEFLTRSTRYRMAFEMNPPYEMIEVRGELLASRPNLIFAASHCNE